MQLTGMAAHYDSGRSISSWPPRASSPARLLAFATQKDSQETALTHSFVSGVSGSSSRPNEA